MSKEMLLIVEALSNEKGVEKEIIVEAIESALASVTARDFATDEVKIRVAIDRKTGEHQTFRTWDVMAEGEEITLPEAQISLVDARQIDSALEAGDVVEEEIPSEPLGRIAAHQARQVITRIVRDAERDKVIARYRSRLGELFTGQAKRVTRDSVILDLGDNVEGLLVREHLIARETIRLNDRVRAYLYAVNPEKKGPQLLLSRTHPQMLVELFRSEVPEVAEQVIEIKAVARDPGSRAKIAVKTNDGRIDPIGACVGMRGSRVQVVSNELNGERVDIVLWDDNPAQLVVNAMSPAEIASVEVDEEAHSMDIIVHEEHLSQAIGRSGQNVRLASELSGWTLNVLSEEEAEQKKSTPVLRPLDLLVNQLDLDEEFAELLLESGFANIEGIANATDEDLLVIEEFDEELVQELKERARKALLANLIAGDDELNADGPQDDLLAVEGVTPELAAAMAKFGIVTREDLAEQSVDELEDIEGLTDELAARLIMAARAVWFEEEK